MLELERLREAIGDDSHWGNAIDTARLAGASLHIGVFLEPYLQYVLEGRKTIESRFSVHRAPPFGRVRSGDILMLKEAAGPVTGLARISHVWMYKLSRGSWSEIRQRFGPALCLEDEEAFITAKQRSRFATLMRLTDVYRIEPVPVDKRDRRGWVVVDDASEALWLPGLLDQ